MDPGFDNLESSFSLDDSLLGQAGSIDNLYHTYLGNMDVFPSGSAAQGAERLEAQYAGTWSYEGQHPDCQPITPVKKKGGRLHREASSASCSTTGAAASLTSSYDTDPWDITSEDVKDFNQYMADEAWDPLVNNLEGLDLQEEFMPIKYEQEEPLCQLPAAAASAAPLSPSNAAAPSADVFKKIPTKSRRRERGPKSWEFLIRLLADKRSNPALIRWEDEASATFRLMQPAIIAQMWGARAEKPNLTYVNFARGLRYHYNTGALMAVSERQLVYRCGPKALQYLEELQERGLC